MTFVMTWHSQTELAINTYTIVSGTHSVVSDTHTMVSDIHHTVVRGQEGNEDKLSVSDTCTPAIAEQLLIIPQTQARSVI